MVELSLRFLRVSLLKESASDTKRTDTIDCPSMDIRDEALALPLTLTSSGLKTAIKDEPRRSSKHLRSKILIFLLSVVELLQ